MASDQSTSPSGRDLVTDAETVGAFWDALVRDGDTHEVRIPKTRRGPARLFGTTAGYFTSRDAAVQAVRRLSGLDAPSVYVTLNPVQADLRARASNRLVTSIAATTADADVTRRRHLLVDLDPSRASEIASTEAEQERALSVRDDIAAFLADRGWPDPVATTMSGNGGGLLYRIDLPNDDESAALVAGCLAALAVRFDTPAVAVDQTVYNAARVTKLIGTVSAKGDDCPDLDRIWRLSTGSLCPGAATVSRGLLEGLASLGTPESPHQDDEQPSGPEFDPASTHGRRSWTVAEVLTRNGIGWRVEQRRYGTAYVLDRCLTSSDHNDGAAIIELHTGALDYRCHHNACRGKGWSDVRSVLGLDAQSSDTRSAGADPSAEAAAEPWRLPIPFDAYAVPSFPVGILPDWLAGYVAALAVATQTPPDLAGLLAIAVLATAAARRLLVRIRTDWVEPLNVYALSILPPGTRKSAVFDAMTAPILDYERDLAAELAPKVAEAQQAQRLAEGRLKAAESAAVKAQPDERAFLEAEARARREELEAIVVPIPPQLIADDVTSEALARLLFDHRERMAVFSAEGDLFEIMAGRYSDGAGNFAVYLKGHAGDMLKVNRVGRPPDYVRHPALTLAITAQPVVLEGLARKDGFRGKGLLARYVYSVPKNLVGQRDAKAPPVPEPVAARYQAVITSLLAKHDPPDAIEAEPTTVPDPLWLSFDALAEARLVAFMADLEPRLGPTGDLSHVPDWGGKLAGLVARVAGLLHLADRWDMPDPERERVSQETVARAIAFGQYALDHALAAFGAMGADPATGGARRLWRWIVDQGEATVRRAAAYQALRGQFPKSADLDAPFALLVEYGYLRPRQVAVDRQAEGRRGPQGRPPSAEYDVNPLALAQGARNAGNPEKGDPATESDDFQHFQDFQQQAPPTSEGRRRVAV